MTTIGTAVLQIIPSLDGVSKSVDKQLSGLPGMGRKAGKQLGSGIADGLKDAEAAYAKLQNKAEDSLGKIRVAEAALTKARSSGDTARIVTAEERLSKARRDSGTAVRDAKTAHDALKASQDSLKGSTSGLGDVMAGLGGKLSTVGAVAGGAALAGIAALGAGAVVAVRQLYELGAQFDDTFDSLRIKTGATGPALQALEDATKRISAGVPLAIGDIGSVVGETSRALHLTGSDLDNVSKNIANLGRLTGENVDVRTLGKAFRGFGVDAKDQVPALDSLFRASQATGVGVNELLATVVKGGAGLRQFGFDFGQSAALATQFEESGLDADKAMAGLTKGLATLAKNGQTGQQALQDNVTQIKNLIAAGDDAGALDLTNKLFGARGGVQFFEAIKNGALDLDALSSSLAGTGDTIAAAAADTDDWSEKWQELKNQAAVALEPLASGVFDTINAQLAGAGDALLEHKDAIVDFFVDLGDIAITGAENVSHGIGGILQAFGDMVGGIGNVKGLLDDLMGDFATLRGDDAAAAAFHASADEAYGWGESLRAAGDKLANLNLDGLRNGLHNAGDAAKDSGDKVAVFGQNVGALPPGKNVVLTVDDAAAKQKLSEFGQQLSNLARAASFPIGPTAPPPGAPLVGGGGSGPPAPPVGGGLGRADGGAILRRASGGLIEPTKPGKGDPQRGKKRIGGGTAFPPQWWPWAVPGIKAGSGTPIPWWMFPGAEMPWFKASGGSVFGPGGPKSDVIPAWLSNGEHVLTASDVAAMGGQGGVYAFRNALHRDQGGAIDRDLLSKVPAGKYSQTSAADLTKGLGDCSSAVEDLVNILDGRSTAGRSMSTANEASWLTAHGFLPGKGGPGDFRVGFNSGHTQATLPDGTPFNWGSAAAAARRGIGGTGADDPSFTSHFFRPVKDTGKQIAQEYADGLVQGGQAAVDSGDLGGAATATTTTPGIGSGLSSISAPSSLSGFGSSIGEQLGQLGSNLGGGKVGDLGKLGAAAGSFVDGQIGSLLDVFGVPSSPGWLKGISTLIGGISIGGGGSAGPLAAIPTGGGVAAPDDPGNMHGGRAGQAPGPNVTINARDTEDAFVKYQRYQDERAAAKLSRF